MLSGCVTETRPTGGSGVLGPREGVPMSRLPGRSGERAELPSGPVAEPALAPSLNSAVRVGVMPIGSVAYDGLTLPLVSPDGRFVAVQTGTAPTWEQLVAADGSGVPGDARIEVHEIVEGEGAPGRASLRPVPMDPQMPAGLLLGRGVTDAGFLVEQPQPDGARWIGLCAWSTGSVRWLVRDGHVNSHAVFTSDGHLLASRREVGEARCVLALHRLRGLEITGEMAIASTATGSLEMPMTTDDATLVFALARGIGQAAGRDSAGAIEVVALSRGGTREDAGTAGAVWPASLGPLVARHTVARRGGVFDAFLSGLVGSSAMVRREDGAVLGGEQGARCVLGHIDAGRLAVFDARRGTITLMAPGSQAGVRVAQGASEEASGGMFVASGTGLSFVPDAVAGSGSGAVRVLDGAYAPRATTRPERALVLFAPDRTNAARLAVVGVAIGPR